MNLAVDDKSESDDEVCAIILDNGSSMIKTGLAGDDAPRDVFSTITGRPRQQTLLTGVDHKECYIGDEAQTNRGILSLDYPIEHGIVTNWDDMEKIWNHALCFSLRINTTEHPIMLTEHSLNPADNRERSAQVMFESFQVPALSIQNSTTLSLYANGGITGTIVDSGDGVTTTQATWGGHILFQSVRREDFGGRDLTIYLQQLLNNKGCSMITTADFEIVRKMKETACYIATDFKQEALKPDKSTDINKTYELPDGKVVSMGSERFKCAEAIFQPSLMGSDCKGLHKIIYDTIQASEIDNRGDLYRYIVLTGGNTMFPGIADRLQLELSKMVPSKTKVRVVALPDRKYSVWIGGSILASFSMFQSMWITKAEYEEYGPNVVHHR